MGMRFLKQKRFLIPIIIIVVTISASWTNRFAIAKYWYMKDFFKLSPDKSLKAHEKDILADREILSKYDLFSLSNGTKDAGPYLNGMVHWEIGPVHHPGSLTIPEFITKELSGEEWIKKKPLFKKMGVNFQWLKDIQKYDVWSLEENSPAYPKDKKFQPFEIPYPTYKDLVTWQKLRYLHAKEKGDVNEALREVRHLMRLMWTNDNLVAAVTVIKMLKVENQFEEITTPKEIGGWAFIPHDHVMRAKRYTYSLVAGTDMRLSDEMFNKLTKTQVGICPALFEGMMFYLGFRDLLSSELAYAYNRMEETVKSSGCRDNVLTHMWEEPGWKTMEEVKDMKILGKTEKELSGTQRKDYLTSVGYILGTLNGPNYLIQAK